MLSEKVRQYLSRTTLCYISGIITAVIALLVLIGWQFDIAIFMNPLAGEVSMKANTAVAFLLAGLALIFLQSSHLYSKWLVRVFSLLVLFTGLLSLCQYLLNYNLGIDEIIFRESKNAVATIHPGRMAPNTALNFMLIGFAFFSLTFQRFKCSFLVEFSLIFSITISFIGLVGYVTGLVEMAGLALYTKMAIHTAAAFILLCSGMLLTIYKWQGSSIKIEQKLFAGLTASTAVIIYISLLSIFGIHSLHEANNRNENAQELHNQIVAVLAQVHEVQSDDHGFVLTGDDNYLVAYNKALDEFPTLMNKIRYQTVNKPQQRKIYTALEKLVEKRIVFSAGRISIRRNEGEAKARLLFPIGGGKVITDSIRILIAQMLSNEDNLLQARNKNETKHANQTELIIYLSLVVQLLLLAFIFVFVKRDVIGRRKAEELFKALNIHLEATNKELESFSYSVSHDLRAPLRHIDGFINLLKKKIFETADDSVKRYLNIISQASKKLGCLIDELLAYSKTGKTKLIPNEVDMDELVKEVLTELKPQMENRIINWQIDQMPRIQSDYNLIKLVYHNLIGNSIKFTKHKEKAEIQLTAKEENGNHIFSVKDNGAGFDMAFSERLFGVFQRLHREDEFEGTGIGLANARRIVHMHSGNIWAEGKVNEGAEITFTIPKSLGTVL